MDKQSEITLGNDGKYRWLYELNLYTNPTILFLLWKIFFWVFFGIFAFVSLLDIGSGHFLKTAAETGKVFGLIILGFFVLTAFAYYLYALIVGGRYCVVFEMDEEGVRHTQVPAQFKKAQILSELTILAGIAAGNIGTVGTGILAQSRSEMYSEYRLVKSITPIKKRNVIKVDSTLCHNQVYVEDADFEFVLNYITQRCPKLK